MKTLDKLLNYCGLNTKQFSEAIGLSRPQALYDIQNGKTKNISPSMASKIISAFPELNKAWLMTGEGNMLREENDNLPIVSQKEEEFCEKDGQLSLTEFIANTIDSIARGVELAGEKCKDTGAIVNPYIYKEAIQPPHSLYPVRFRINLSKLQSESGNGIGVYLPEKVEQSPVPINKSLETSTTIDFEVMVRLPETNVDG